jgi:type IV secretion system protein VirB9
VDAARQPDIAGREAPAQPVTWREGATYRLQAAPERVSLIALQPGESLISVAAGGTSRWIIGDTTSGAGAARRTHVLVKPSAAGLRTNLVITTDRRVYLVELESSARTGLSTLSWSYGQDDLLALARAHSEAPAAAGVAVDALNFGYTIEGDDPPWRPLRAFDDGQQVFIEFPASLAGTEAPPLFVLGAEGAAQLVNYRLRGRFYVVDRLFAAAELRLGERRQQVVRIRRGDAGRRLRRGRR